jgi:hypothetical protein
VGASAVLETMMRRKEAQQQNTLKNDGDVDE